MLLAALLLCLPVVQEADRSSPEKALESLGTLMSRVGAEAELLGSLRMKLDALGDDLFEAEGKAHRVNRRAEVMKAVGAMKMLGVSFEEIRVSDVKADVVPVQATQVMRMERTDSETGKKTTGPQKEVHQFGFVKDGTHWLIQSMRSPCKLCDGKGLCFICEGKGVDNGAPCRDCAGKKSCPSCNGKKEMDQVVPNFLFLMVSDQTVEFKPDLSTPEKAAQGFADYLTKKAVDESSAEMESYRLFLSKYREGLAPAAAKGLDEGFAKAVAAGTERFRTQRPKVESFGRKGTTATAVIKEPQPPELAMLRFKDHEHRIVLKQSGDRWLIVQDQMPCPCEGKEPNCPGCKGAGWTDR